MRNLKMSALVLSGIIFSWILGAQEGMPPRHEPRGGEKNFQPRNEQMMPGKDLQGNPEMMRDRLQKAKKIMKEIAAENPERAAELKKLRESNPDQFHRELQAAIREHVEKKKAEKEEMKKLVDIYNETKSEDVKNKIADRLKDKLGAKIEQEKKMLSKLEERYKKLKERVEKREKNKDEMVKSRLTEMLKDPDLKW